MLAYRMGLTLINSAAASRSAPPAVFINKSAVSKYGCIVLNVHRIFIGLGYAMLTRPHCTSVGLLSG